MQNAITRTMSRWGTIIWAVVLAFICDGVTFAGSATLSWSANPESNIAGYKVYYGTASHVYDNVINVGLTTTYTVGGLGPGTYYFAVTAYNTGGAESAPSSEVTKVFTSTADSSAPTIPAGLAATAVSSSQINLTWSASTDDVGVMGYKIFQNGTQIGTTATTSYSSTNLTASTTYSYAVAAYDAAGNTSGSSSSASATTTAASSAPALVSINFQPAGAVTPNGYQADDGSVFTTTRGYGWDVTMQSRERNLVSDKRLDTFVFSQTLATWNYNIANGSYLVSLASGDAGFAQGPHRIDIEGLRAVNDVSTAGGNDFITVTDFPVTVTDGTLTVRIGGTTGNTMLNYLLIRSSGSTTPPSLLPAPTNVRVK